MAASEQTLSQAVTHAGGDGSESRKGSDGSESGKGSEQTLSEAATHSGGDGSESGEAATHSGGDGSESGEAATHSGGDGSESGNEDGASSLCQHVQVQSPAACSPSSQISDPMPPFEAQYVDSGSGSGSGQRDVPADRSRQGAGEEGPTHLMTSPAVTPTLA